MKKVVTKTGLTIFLVFMLSMPSLASLSFCVNSYGGDSPRDAPKDKFGISTASPQQLGSSSSGTEFSPSTDADPWVKFKVNEGWDLDLYLFLESSPIDFYIDVDDFKPDPTISPKPTLTLRVYDVDVQGTPGCGPEVDVVCINGHTLGVLTGANEQWSICTFDVEPSFICEGNNHVQVFIDTTGSECWAVEVDFGELRIPFNIKVIKIEVTKDIDINKTDPNVLIAGPIWEKKFDSKGNLVDVPGVGGDTKRDYPIAGWFTNPENLEVTITLSTWPEQWKTSLKWRPKITVFWIIWGTGQLHRFSVNAWECAFHIWLPQAVGKYKLSFDFWFDKDDVQIASLQMTDHTLYVTLLRPRNDVRQPKEIWLEYACKWAEGAKNDVEVASKLNSGIYNGAKKLGWIYEDSVPRWDDLLEGKVADKKANCWVLAQVWRNLARVLGIEATAGPTEQTFGAFPPPPFRGWGFVTEPSTAFDGKTGNAHNLQTRWKFSMHQTGQFKNKFYDPTFGKEYNTLRDFIECDIISGRKHDPVRNQFYWDCTGGHKIYLENPGPADVWGKYKFESEQNESGIAKTSTGAEFTDIFSDYGVDIDGDGLYEYLGVSVGINVTSAGNYTAFGELNFNNTFITTRRSGNNQAGEFYSFSAGIGIKTINLSFSGNDIFKSGMSGSYNVSLILLNINSSLVDNKTYCTSTYCFSQFREVPAFITGATDYGEDLDHDGLFDILVVKIDVNASRIMDCTVNGILGINATLVSSAFNKTSLKVGTNVIRLNFDGREVMKSMMNGPYTLTVSLSDNRSLEIDSKEFSTQTYNYSQFERPSIQFTCSFSDYGTDTNSDGLFNYLTIEVGINVTMAGNYTMMGWLYDTDGGYIAMTSNRTYLALGTQSILLNFTGVSIYKHEVNGSYNLKYLRLYDKNINEINSLENAYNTSAYSYTEFQRPKASFTGTYSDYGVDTDIESTYTRTYLPHEWVGGGTPMGWHGDDDSWSYTLPFDFPFYGTNYTTIYISSNGLITFLSPDGSYSNSISALAGKLAIAPAWDDWVTDEPHDIYTWQNSTHLGIRWYVRAYGSSIVANFEAILSVNGQIQFNYGYNNGTVSTTIGVSNGAGDILAEDMTNLNNINTIIFTPSQIGDGLFNHLTIQAELNVTKPGNYTLEGALCDAEGSLIVSRTTESHFGVGTQLFALDFDGVAIYSHGFNGPYNLRLLRFYDESGSIIDAGYNVYNTTAYNYTDFQRPIIKLTGIFSDYGIDTDADGFYDFLVLEIEVMVTYDGTYEINARLKDVNGNEIVWASNSTYLYKDVLQTIQLRFCGKRIFGNGVNGPYYVKDLSIYYSIFSLYVSDVYTTSTYNYTEFQKSGIILGTVTDEQAAPVPNALVYVSGVDYDHTNINGSYKLIILQTGTYTVEVTPPPELNLLGNSTTTDVTVGETTIVNFVLRGVHDVAVVNVTLSKTVVGQGYSTSINVTVENQGAYTETFNVTVCYNETAIILPNGKNHTTITLPSGNSTTITLTWNTTGVAKGNYTIRAYAWSVSGEIDITDNTFIDGLVEIVIHGDVNGDGIVDIFDLVLVASAYGSTPADPNWNPNADINGDNIIDIFDLVIVASHYGETDQ